MQSSSRLVYFLAGALCLSGAAVPQESPKRADFDVTVSMDAADQGGRAAGAVKIHARREVVWELITSCAESLRLVPELEVCEVLESAPDRSWQRIREVLNYRWFLPKLNYVIQATYDRPSQISIERISGDVRTLKGSWMLKTEGDFTVAHYSMDLVPGFWVPQWLVGSAMRRELPKMLRALRARAETIESQKPNS